MLYSYVPSQVKCSVFGVELVGLAKDSFVSIERIDNNVTFRKAQDGSHTAFIDNFGSYRVTIRIEQGSESNNFLHLIYKLHKRSGMNLKIPLAVYEKMGDGGTELRSFETFFETEPATEYGRESTSKDWVFVCHNASYTLRGTGETGFLIDSLKSTLSMIELSEAYGLDLSTLEGVLDIAVTETQERLKNLF